MSILIVGCGYLGKRIAVQARARGHHLFATTRSMAHAEELRRLDVEPLLADVVEPSQIPLFPSVETIVYAIGFDRTTGRSMRDIYVGGLANVLAKLPPAGRFLYVSSTSVYGQTHGEEVDETAATEPLEESGKVVLAAEQLLLQQRPDAVRLRFAGMYGPGRLLRQQALLAGEPLVADPETWLNLIHVEDGATAVLAAAMCARPGEIYNVADDRPARRRAFYTRLAELLGAAPPRFVVPADPLATPGNERTNRRIVNQRLRQELGVQLRYPSFAEGLLAAQ